MKGERLVGDNVINALKILEHLGIAEENTLESKFRGLSLDEALIQASKNANAGIALSNIALIKQDDELAKKVLNLHAYMTIISILEYAKKNPDEDIPVYPKSTVYRDLIYLIQWRDSLNRLL